MSTESPAIPPSILVVDDDADIVKAATLLLTRNGMAVTGAADPEAAWVALAEKQFDAILLDLNFARGRTSGEEGFAMLDRLLVHDRDAIVIVVTGHSGIAVAVRAMKAGAADFVIKPWSNERLLATVERAVTLRQARGENTDAPVTALDPLLGEDAAIVRARELAKRVGPTAAAVLVRGPAGSGKTLFARHVHRLSGREGEPVVVTGTAALAADWPMNATLLIEDVETVSVPDQRALALRLGENVRAIATSRLARGALREALVDDLLYRLNTIELDLPPLAARGDDTLLLARHFVRQFASRHGKPPRDPSEEAARALAQDMWPDNVRGLRQACERAVLLGTGNTLAIGDFALSIDTDAPIPRAAAADLNLARGEKAMVEAALQRHAFNVSRAAAELGLTRAALYRRMEKYGL
jgi:DNA-binding NtrC family response regulator